MAASINDTARIAPATKPGAGPDRRAFVRGDPVSDPVADILARLEGVRPCGPDKWEARCPAHDDQHASLSVGRGEGGRVLLHCHAGCGPIAVVQALGLRLSALFPARENRPDKKGPLGEIVATYDYLDAQGTLLFQVVRFKPKAFRQRRPDTGPDSRDGWVWNLDGVQRVLYRLPELLAADPGAWIFVVEGEKDADALAGLGLVATCNPGGAGKWRDEYAEPLVGRRVCVIPDRDDAGRVHAQNVARRLVGKAAEVRILALPGEGKDVSDWIAAGGTAIALLALADAAPPWTPPAAAPGSDGPVSLGQRDPATGRLVLSPKRTLPTARAYVREFYTHPDGRTLLSYAGLLMEWRENRYVEVEDETLRQRLQPWLHDALRYMVNRGTGELKLIDFESNPGTVAAAADTIRNYVHVPASITAPAWLDGDTSRPPASELMPCRSMVLHLPTLTRIEPTPQLFVTSALDFDYNPNAPPPIRWYKFLDEVLPDDPESVRLLQTWCGYVLTGDTRLQKMLMLVGAKRSGKGTIARILTRLLGAANVCGPSTSNLAGPFGLQSLIGKSLAIVSDARFSGDHVPIVVERLLCISGEDTLTVERKFLGAVTLKLPTRFMFLTNELPKLSESSGALAGRFLVLKFTQSFYGREDPFLTDSLRKELPGILKWAIRGWQHLQADGRFIEPASSREAVENLEDLLSPIGAFVRERCTVGSAGRAYVDHLYAAWCQWCQSNGRDHPGTVQSFCRDLAAAVPGARTRRDRMARFVEGVQVANA